MKTDDKAKNIMAAWRKDWVLFAKEVLRVNLDEEQKAILRSVQHNKMTAVASGTARGKDFIAACAAMCFMYLTPTLQGAKLVGNTKIALTAPTGRQVQNIMIPEVTRLFRNAGGVLPGYLRSDGIKTDYSEWFMTGFKADDTNTEAWSGFHAVNTMFVVTEASGVSETIFNAIEGNLQGNSRLLIVFNPNTPTGYAANAMKSERFNKFRLSSLNAANVVAHRVVIPGQVDYDWVSDKVHSWCAPIPDSERVEDEGDFVWEGVSYRPNDLFRVKVLGMFPKVAEDVLIPYEWIEAANRRWEERQGRQQPLRFGRIGVDVAGMGRDNSVIVPRYGNYVPEIIAFNSGGNADHMALAGRVKTYLDNRENKAMIDTIGEGAGVYSRLVEQGCKNAFSCKFSAAAHGLSDETGVYAFANLRAYCYWAVRDWLNPSNGYDACLPVSERLIEEATNVKWKFQSDGRIIIEPKDDVKKRIHRSPDYMDALANTFMPTGGEGLDDDQIMNIFH